MATTTFQRALQAATLTLANVALCCSSPRAVGQEASARPDELPSIMREADTAAPDGLASENAALEEAAFEEAASENSTAASSETATPSTATDPTGETRVAAEPARTELERIPPPRPEPTAQQPDSARTMAEYQTNESNASQSADARPGELGVRVEDGLDGRVMVRGVIVGSAAELAGIRPGDRIVSIDERPLDRANELYRYVASQTAGTSCALVIEHRNGQTENVTATLDPQLGRYLNRSNQQRIDRYGNTDYVPRYGNGRVYRRSYRPYVVAPAYGYYGTPRFGYYDRGWGRGGLQLGPLNIFW